jgi:hypothetical protein
VVRPKDTIKANRPPVVVISNRVAVSKSRFLILTMKSRSDFFENCWKNLYRQIIQLAVFFVVIFSEGVSVSLTV